MIEINVKHDDIGVSAAIAAVIENALAQHGFTNVKGKMVMSTQEYKLQPENFTKTSELTPLVSPQTEKRPSYYETMLFEARVAFGYPVMIDWLRQKHPELLDGPILIDANIEATPYRQQLKAFKEGTDREAV